MGVVKIEETKHKAELDTDKLNIEPIKIRVSGQSNGDES